MNDPAKEILFIVGLPISWMIAVWMATSAIATNRSVYLVWKYLISDEAINVYSQYFLTRYATSMSVGYLKYVRRDKQKLERNYYARLGLFAAYSFLTFHLLSTVVWSIDWFQDGDYGIAQAALIIFGWMCIFGFLIVYRHTNLLLKLDAQYPNDVRRKPKRKSRG